MTRGLVDQAARDRAVRDLDASLVLEAGAGTGKTTLLVERIHALVTTGRARLDQIAAVTFTENAATTLKFRLRERLERTRAGGDAAADRAAVALDTLETAQISTIHALAAALIHERPMEFGVAPGVRTADEAQAAALFGEAFEAWLDESLARAEPALIEALDAGIPLAGSGPWGERASLRGLADELRNQRDLVPFLGRAGFDQGQAVRRLRPKAKLALRVASKASAADAMVDALNAFAGSVLHLPVDETSFEAALVALPSISSHLGQRSNWPPDALRAARGLGHWWKDTRETWLAELAVARHARVVRLLRGVLDHYERHKRAAGVLDFLDLLLVAERTLAANASVREYFRKRFAFVLIDEFQDTDPLQVRLAHLLSDGRPGGLVIVGDPKQSIYRFRRAEVELFARASEEAAKTPGQAVLHLTQNFRSRPAIVRFVNRVFSEVLVASPEAGQTGYEPLAASPGQVDEPAVVGLAFEAPFAQGVALVRAEAAALADFIATVAHGGQEVRRGDALRRSRGGDVMVLSRRLTNIGLLEEALESRSLTFSVEGGRSFFDRQEVHEVLAVLRAIDDPADRVAMVAALRSSFFGVSDREIAQHFLEAKLPTTRESEDPLEGTSAVAEALRLMGALRCRRREESVPLLLERLYDETRVLAALTGGRRGESKVANLEKVVNMARETAQGGILTLTGFIRHLAVRIAEGGDEADLPSTAPQDTHSIRILSIHRAKGLEAPVVALFDSADNHQTRVSFVPLREDGKVAIGFRPNAKPPGWAHLKEREERRVRAEGLRLLYVACTRPQDLLVIPLPPPDAESGSFWREISRRLPAQSDDDVRIVRAADLVRQESHANLPEAGCRIVDEDAVAATWEAARSATLEYASRHSGLPVSVTSVAARSAAPRVGPAPDGRGPAFGDLVHRLLAWGEDGVARWTARATTAGQALGLDAAECAAAADEARRAWDHPLLVRARSARRVVREWPVAWLEAGELVEGVVDLLFEEDDGLVLVDYKSDALSEPLAPAQAAHHASQLHLYAKGVERATGRSVKERFVLFTRLGLAVPV